MLTVKQAGFCGVLALTPFCARQALAQAPSKSFDDAPGAQEEPPPSTPGASEAPAPPVPPAPTAAPPPPAAPAEPAPVAPAPLAPAPAPPVDAAPAPAPTPAPVPASPPPPVGYPGLPPPAYPQPYEPPPPPRAKPEPRRYVSITIDPLLLFQPEAELTAEVRLARFLGIAAIGGIGSVSAYISNDADERLRRKSFSIYEGGAQLNLYVSEDFEGLHFGGEVLYRHIEGDVDDVDYVFRVFDVGPYIGYKAITRPGFTFTVQGGVIRSTIREEAREPGEPTDRESYSDWDILLNLNLGWSF